MDVLCHAWGLVLAVQYRALARGALARLASPRPSEVRAEDARRLASGLPARAWSWATRARWYRQRAQSLELKWQARAATCGQDYHRGSVALACAACAWQGVRPIRCGLTAWCEPCGRRYRGRVYARMVRGLRRAHAAEMKHWNATGRLPGRRPVITLVTLTISHSGSLADDRRTLGRAWKRLRSWLHHQDGRALPYALAWELTPGADGLGHVHAHVACVWPWRDLRALDAEWQRVTEGRGRTIDVQSAGRAQREGRIRTADAGAAASYIAAYVEGGGASAATPLAMRAEWLRLLRTGARRYSASALLMSSAERAKCPTCSERALTSQGYQPPRRYGCVAQAQAPPCEHGAGLPALPVA